jgi:hypothetical protein
MVHRGGDNDTPGIKGRARRRHSATADVPAAGTLVLPYHKEVCTVEGDSGYVLVVGAEGMARIRIKKKLPFDGYGLDIAANRIVMGWSVGGVLCRILASGIANLPDNLSGVETWFGLRQGERTENTEYESRSAGTHDAPLSCQEYFVDCCLFVTGRCAHEVDAGDHAAHVIHARLEIGDLTPAGIE